ncbi:MAG TPA: HAD hydrolase-like protein, partial [Aliidiomarina sp.]|nr:HAD hydrolase-like protein [Aliidiomarina sp.]
QLQHPSQMLHIGDHPISDVQGALRFGAQALWYNSPFKPAEGVPAVTHLPHATIENLQALRALL